MSSAWGERLTIIVPAVLAYVPLLLTQPGKIGADTKTYLYLDPAKLLSDAPYVWDNQIGLGTVTHQNIGYLFPMGPFYLLFDLLRVPDWIAQRLWMGSLIFAAGMGVRYLLRTIDFGGMGPSRDHHLGRWHSDRRAATTEPREHAAARQAGLLVATLGYMLSPYLLDYSARISVILLPWVALPWLIALVARSLRSGGWFYPALFALVVLAVGGINATALIMVGFAPLLFLVHAVWVDKEASWRQAFAVMARITVLVGVTSLWWIAGLWAEGKYGLPVIRYTETYRAVAGASNANEVLRGLGYWFFYGNDKLGPWVESSVDYTNRLPILALSYVLPITALLTAALVRWRYRAYFMIILVFGTLIAVGGHPWETPPFLGGFFKEFTKTNAGLALRSTPRAVPVVVLATSVFLGAGVTALCRRIPARTAPIALIASALIVANIPTLWNGTMIAKNLERPEQIPSYWSNGLAFMDAGDQSTRVWEVPGADFASYRWGNTVDPITPGLIARPYVARELFQWGSPQSAAMLNAYDRRLQEGIAEPEALAPIARTFAVGDVVLRADLQYERYRTARPRDTWPLLLQSPGLQAPVAFTPPTNSQATEPQPLRDELELQRLQEGKDAPLLSDFAVTEVPPMVRAQSAERPMLLAGDADGLVDAATVGLLRTNQPVFLSASYDNSKNAKVSTGDDANFDRIYDSGADLVVTDTNRKRAARWGALRENNGYTERAGETPPRYDPGDQRLEVFPAAGESSFTVSEQRGGVVTATAYGNPITYTPDDRPANAFDGDPATAWRVGAIDNPVGERLSADLSQPVTADRVTLTQPLTLVRNRWITKVRLSFDDGASVVDADLGFESRRLPGQTISFPSRSFKKLEIEITEDDLGPKARYDGVSGVGFSEVKIPGVTISELIRPPTQLLDRAGSSSIDRNLALLFTRVRSNPAEPVRTDEEARIQRVVNLPTARSFSVSGAARLSSYAPEPLIDRLLAVPDARQGGVTSSSSAYLPAAINQRAAMAIDGDPTTAWTAIYDKQAGQWLEYVVPAPISFDRLDLDLVADGAHSVPTKLRIDADGQVATTVDIPAVPDKDQRGATTRVSVPLDKTVTGSQIRIAVEGVRQVKTTDWYTNNAIDMPVSIAEVGIPGLRSGPAAPVFDTGCRDDLLAIDGTPVPLRVFGLAANAVDREPLRAEPCGAEPTIDLSAGDHVFTTASGGVAGIDIDRLVFGSAAGGGPRTIEPSPDGTDPSIPNPPKVEVNASGRVSYDATVAEPSSPFWLVVGQSWSPGWQATANGVSLGPPQVVNGYANGWYVDPAKLDLNGASLQIRVEWAPQRIIWIAIGISAVGLLVCLGLLFFSRRRARHDPARVEESERPFDPSFDPADDPAAPAPVGGFGGGRRRLLRLVRRLVLPGRGGRLPLPWTWVALAAAPVVLFALVNLPIVWWQLATIVPFAALVVWAYRRPDARGVLGLAAATCLAAAAAFYLVQQFRHRFPPDFVWPQLFDRVHVLGLLAVFLIGAEAVRELVFRAWHADTSDGHHP
ncbi:MAG: DUF3367 domain-containing protein [Actinobacteria bacterium]|nr:DUF3367 domain-containing protein [Actinomycetota bacterium]